MLLAEFITKENEAILVAWEDFARGMLAGSKMDTLALRDHAPEILTATVHDMNYAQS